MSASTSNNPLCANGFRRGMAVGCVLFFSLGTLLLGAATPTSFGNTPLQSVRSQSGQFVVQGPAEILPSAGYINSPVRDRYVRLDQNRLAVMAERVRQALMRELQAPDQYRGRIFISLRRASDVGEPVYARAQNSDAGWFYTLDIPSEMEPPRLMRVLVEVLVKEMANRNSGPRLSELPPWLIPGIAAHLESLIGSSFILDDNTPNLQYGSITTVRDSGKTVRVEKRADLIKNLHGKLGDRLPLSLDELNWPTDEQLMEPPGGFYEANAHLFVYHIMRLPGGADCLKQMLLTHLPQYLNWQIGFLKAFEPHFKSLRDADKWWAIQVAAFSGREAGHVYTFEESMQKIEEILVVRANVHIKKDALPDQRTVNLQEVVANWPAGVQKNVIQQKIVQLRLLRMKVAPELIRLTDDYRLALEEYLSRRGRSGYAAEIKGAPGDSLRLAARKTVEQLQFLDVVRGDLKKKAP